MIEIIGSEMCPECIEAVNRLVKSKVSFTFHDVHEKTERIAELNLIAVQDGYFAIPLIFKDNDCLGAGLSAIKRLGA